MIQNAWNENNDIGSYALLINSEKGDNCSMFYKYSAMAQKV